MDSNFQHKTLNLMDIPNMSMSNKHNNPKDIPYFTQFKRIKMTCIRLQVWSHNDRTP